LLKVNLKPGEKRRVKLMLDERALSYYDVDSKQWRANPGQFEVLVGSSSENIQPPGPACICRPQEPPQPVRCQATNQTPAEVAWIGDISACYLRKKKQHDSNMYATIVGLERHSKSCRRGAQQALCYVGLVRPRTSQPNSAIS